VLSTSWDSKADASEFADAMNAWLGQGEDLGVVVGPDATSVEVLFASDAATRTPQTAASVPTDPEPPDRTARYSPDGEDARSVGRVGNSVCLMITSKSRSS
jgi:hypothetical protein